MMLLALLCIVNAQSSVPEIGQYNRYRAAPRNSLLSIVPVDGAEFLIGQHFDISIELHKIGVKDQFPDLSGLQATVNQESLTKMMGKTKQNDSSIETWNFEFFENAQAKNQKRPTPVSVSRYSLRTVKFTKAGVYKVSLKVGSEKVHAQWTIRASGERKVKNLVLFIGDGMAPTMISAARFVSKKTTFGKFGKNLLNMEMLGSVGKIITNGIDSIITDSANSAATYLTGQKGWVSGLNVYADTSADPLDDPKVESLTEFIRSNRKNMCIGVVTTAEIQDATPGAALSHSRERTAAKEITDQAIFGATHKNLPWDPKPVLPDVLMGGGGRSFCQTKIDGNVSSLCSTFKNKDYYQEFKNAGFSVVKSKTELDAHRGNGPLLGIFSLKHMDTWMDRMVYPENLKLAENHPDGTKESAIDQPGLEKMTIKAIEVMSSKCSDGFFLLAEAALIDKSMHAIDYDRGLAEILELDRTVKAVKDWADSNKSKGETGIIVTADHAQAFDVYGSVDTEYFNSLPDDDSNLNPNPSGNQKTLQYQKRQSIGEYDLAGWPDLVTDEKGLPTKWKGRYKLAAGKVDALPHKEDFQLKQTPVKGTNPLTRQSAIKDVALSTMYNVSSVMVESPNEKGIYISPSLPVESTSTVHSLQSVDLYCYGPAAFRIECSRVMDNTELFFIMADALGLGQDGSRKSSVPFGSTENDNFKAVVQ